MKKMLATVATLSLVLIACGDDASSTAPDPLTGNESSSSETVLSSGVESSSGAKSSSSTKEPSSSETPESSSSLELPVESSSSVIVPVDPHQVITDANGQCNAKGLTRDPMVDASEDVSLLDTVTVREGAIPPVAYRYVGTERTGFTLENLMITCGLVVDTLDVNVSGDTVYVNAVFDRTNAMRCICDFKIEFAVENSDAYAQATVLVFGDAHSDGGTPDIMQIVDMDVISVEEATGRKQAKDIKLECKNDRQTANAPALASNSFVMDPIDTTSTKVAVAGRRVGDDGFDTIVIPEVMMPCGITFERFDVYASSGMLYVEPVEAADSPITNCICPTRVSFRIEQNEAFSNTQYLVFSREKPMPLVETVPVDASVLEN